MRLKDIVNESIMLSEKQFKGLEGIPANKSLEKISKAEKLNIIKAKGNIINFIVPAGVSRNFWQVISTGSIKKSSSGNIVMLMGQGPMNSPSFKTIDDLIDGVDWKAMEQRRRFNEGVTEAKEIKWQDVEVGDSANVTASNKTGVIVKTYGRKFHLKFVDGTTKTFDANELSFVKQEGINELTHNEKSIRDGNPNNVYYAFYKGQFEAIYSAMGPSGLFDMYWDKFKVRKPAGAKFKLNPEFVFISKKDYDSSTSNRYAKLKPHVDKLWDTLKKESVNEGKYYVGYNKGRGQGTGVFKDVFSTYKDAKKELEKIEKQRGGSYHQIAYYVADEKGNFVREAMLGEGRGIKSIQNDLDKTVVAIESEIASYKATKGTPQEKKHIDNLKKLHPIKKKLQSELDIAVSGLYRDAELKIED
jgi:hypothetical protein